MRMENKNDRTEINKIEEKHNELRKILADYGDEFGDVIVDEICDLFGYPNTNIFEYDEVEENES